MEIEAISFQLPTLGAFEGVSKRSFGLIESGIAGLRFNLSVGSEPLTALLAGHDAIGGDFIVGRSEHGSAAVFALKGDVDAIF
nr:hypothetical protein [Marinicauda sp. Alg238-R41]